MNTLKWIGSILLACICALCVVSCNDTPETPNTVDTTTATEADVTTAENAEQTTTAAKNENEFPENPENCTHDEVVETVVSPALALQDGEKLVKCSNCGNETREVIPMTKTLKLLAIGNSFTVDPTYNLWGICHDAGIENLVIATFHIGSCTFKMHWNNFRYNLPNYTYYKATSTETKTTTNVAPETVFADEDWDVFVYHQSSMRAMTNDNLTSVEQTFDYLDDIYNYLSNRFPKARHFYQMAWAYQSDCTQSEFLKYYGGDQQKNYASVLNMMKNIITPTNLFDAIIPVGTAIQNLRTSYFGDTVTRDGYHLNYGYGRWTASLCWYAVVTGGSIDNISWYMSKYPDIKDHMPLLKESVANSLKTPYEVTQSKYTTAP